MFLSIFKATAVFSYDSIKGKFIAPVHVEREEAREKRAAQKLKDEKVNEYRGIKRNLPL